MVKLNKIYTRRGDQGQTQLAAGRAISKTSARIIALGEIDELNASLGFVNAALNDDSELKILALSIEHWQQLLFNLGAQLAVLAADRRVDTPLVTNQDIVELENSIDKLNQNLPALNSFVLPGGHDIAARLHLARAICRRAERAVVILSSNETLDGTEIPFLNRLSDWLFVAARWVNFKLQVAETLWQPTS